MTALQTLDDIRRALNTPLDPTQVLDNHGGRALWGAYQASDARSILDEYDDCHDNLDRALAIVADIDAVRSVQRELKAAFARDELDGGARAALDHPLYLLAQERLAGLHTDLKGLI